jgi:hypothetical protein
MAAHERGIAQGERDEAELSRGRQRAAARATERAGELGEDRQVGMEPDPLDSTDAERQ